jgi:hypothetical protein
MFDMVCQLPFGDRTGAAEVDVECAVVLVSVGLVGCAVGARFGGLVSAAVAVPVAVVGFGDDVSVVGVSVGLGGGLLGGVGVAAGCTVMLAQPSDAGAGPGGPALSADTHTRWLPGAAGIEAPKPWLPATL